MNDNNRILIIDDNKSIHDDFKKILIPRKMSESLVKMNSMLTGESGSSSHLPNFEIDSAFQSQEGINLVSKSLERSTPYAVAFVDVQMPPGSDGVETIGKIWKMDLNIQTVICTAYSKYTWEELHGKFGYSDRLFVLKKPFDSIEVIQMAVALTRKWNIYRAIRQQLSLVNSLPEDKKESGSFDRLKKSIESLSRLTSRMKDKE